VRIDVDDQLIVVVFLGLLRSARKIIAAVGADRNLLQLMRCNGSGSIEHDPSLQISGAVRVPAAR
jgi:hypothetical protein